TRLQLELVCARLLLPGADDSVSGVQARLDRVERRLAGGGEPAAAAEAGESQPPPASARPEPTPEPAEPAPAPPQPAPAAPAPRPAADPTPQSAAEPASGGVADVRRMWPEVLVRLREIKRTPWSLISQESTVADVSDGVLTLAFRKPTLRDTFARREDFQAC